MQIEEYARMFAVEDTHWWFAAKRRFVRVLLDKLPAQSSRKILDVGCGTGGMHSILSKYGEVYGVDASEAALEFARRRKIARLQRAKLPELPFADETFDLVTLFDVLYHRDVGDDQRGLQEVARVLRPSGFVLITDCAFLFLRSAHDDAHHGARRYDITGLRTKLKSAGFTIKRVSYIHCWIFPAVACWRIAQRIIANCHGSDLRAAPAWFNGMMSLFYRVEARILSRADLPFGTSVIALAQKQKP